VDSGQWTVGHATHVAHIRAPYMHTDTRAHTDTDTRGDDSKTTKVCIIHQKDRRV